MDKDRLAELIDTDFPDMEVTEETRQNTMQYSYKVGCRGNVRLAIGNFYTNQEYEAWRQEQLAPLP